MVSSFAKKYPGVTLEVQAGTGGDLAIKVTTEQNSGQVSADVLAIGLSAVSPFYVQGSGLDFIPLAIKEPGVKWIMDPLREQANFPGKPFPTIFGFAAHGLVVNTKSVPKEKEPSGWQALLDPSWKGKIVSADPRVSGAGNKAWYFMKAMYGEQFWQKLVNQGVTIEQTPALVARDVARGDYAVGIGVGPREVVVLSGAPIKYLIPLEGALVADGGAMLVKGAPHPNAARLFINFLFTDEAQGILGQTGTRTPIRVGAKLADPSQSLEGQKLLQTTTQEDLGPVSQARQDVKKYVGG